MFRAALISTISVVALAAQQQPGVPAQQPPSALQLPASGRSDSSGTVTTQQSISPDAGSNAASVVQPSVTVTGDYQGSIPGPPLPVGPVKLSLAEAVKRGLQVNLGVITAGLSSASARAQRAQVLSQLLPQITANLGATEAQSNLVTTGLTSVKVPLPIPSTVGPFHYVQGQGDFSWNAVSFTGIRNYQAIKQVDRASILNQRDARELVVLAVAGSYLQVIAAAARIESEKAQVRYAEATYEQSTTQLAAGTNVRVDVSRSFVQLQTEQERLMSFQSDYEQQKLAFARLIGVPQNAELIFTDALNSAQADSVDEDTALQSAFDNRWDLRAARAQVKAAELALSAARAERLPSVSVTGYYGASGVDPTSAHGDFTVSGNVSIPIFDGGRIRADVSQSEAVLQQRQAEYADEKARVEQDVRNALIQLRTAAGQVKLAQSNREYALQTLTQSQDRFAAGVTNTVEVVQAEQQLATADSDQISSLFALDLARLSLARATGEDETRFTSLLGGGHQ